MQSKRKQGYCTGSLALPDSQTETLAYLMKLLSSVYWATMYYNYPFWSACNESDWLLQALVLIQLTIHMLTDSSLLESSAWDYVHCGMSCVNDKEMYVYL